jgi:hypothetical protein
VIRRGSRALIHEIRAQPPPQREGGGVLPDSAIYRRCQILQKFLIDPHMCVASLRDCALALAQQLAHGWELGWEHSA